MKCFMGRCYCFKMIKLLEGIKKFILNYVNPLIAMCVMKWACIQ